MRIRACLRTCGERAHLFRRGDGYLGAELLRCSDDSEEYLTLDSWASSAAYEASRAGWSDEYRRLEHRLEELPEEERPLEAFEALPQSVRPGYQDTA